MMERLMQLTEGYRLAFCGVCLAAWGRLQIAYAKFRLRYGLYRK